MNHTSCPTTVVNAPVELVWNLLTHPQGWGDFYNLRILSVDPAGPAVVGQTISAEPGPRFIHLKISIRFVQIDPTNHRLVFDAFFPFGITVHEDLNCIPLDPDHCRVNYNCGFAFPQGWLGTLTHFLIRRRLDAGPADSLSRLQRAAERLHAAHPKGNASSF
jgi:Polyketide cyclase / dehydrase and lipid transport